MSKRIIAPGSFSNHSSSTNTGTKIKTVSTSAILQKPDYLSHNIRRVKSKNNTKEEQLVVHDDTSIKSSSISSSNHLYRSRNNSKNVQSPRNIVSKRQLTSETLVHHKLLLEKTKKSNKEVTAILNV